MTIAPTAPTNNISALVTEFAGGAASDISMMIGVGLIKDTDAVFFQYLGEGVEPMALVQNSGRPLTRLGNVKLAGISVADDIGEFNSTKLNVILESSAGTQVMVTSGLSTIWSQCLLNGLTAMVNGGDISWLVSSPFNLDTWKGTSKMRPCFAAVRVGQVAMKDNDLYTLLSDARADGNKKLVEQLCRNAVTAISDALAGGPVKNAVVTQESGLADALADF